MIIGITGKAGAGKSTIGDLIQSHMEERSAFARVVRIGFADEVKAIAKNCFGWDGKKDEKGRRLLQLIGTECGRGYNENIWVEKLARHDAKDACLIVDDVRFNNEAELCKRLGFLIHISGRADDLGENSGHASEKGVDIAPDFRIVNCGGLELLDQYAMDIVKKILEA